MNIGSAGDRRRLSWPAAIGLIVAFALAPSVFGVFFLHTHGGDIYPDAPSVLGLIARQAVGLALVAFAVSFLRWWPVVIREGRRVRPWVWVVPITQLALAIALIDFSRLAAAGPALVLALLAGTLLIAAGEELLFRGVILTFLRDRHSELAAAVGSALLFGVSHAPAGPLAVAFTAVSGYTLYYTRRVSGGIAMPILVHTLWDFSTFSAYTTDSPAEGSNAAPALFLVSLVLVLVLAVGHRAAEPRVELASQAAGS